MKSRRIARALLSSSGHCIRSSSTCGKRAWSAPCAPFAQSGGEAWVKYQVDWKLKGPYAMRRNLTGLEGLIALYQDYRSMTDALFDRLKLDKVAIENSKRDWTRYNQQVLERLGLDGVPSAN